MAECIYSNSINKSILTAGFTIPVDKWELFEQSLGVSLQKGEKKDILAGLRRIFSTNSDDLPFW